MLCNFNQFNTTSRKSQKLIVSKITSLLQSRKIKKKSSIHDLTLKDYIPQFSPIWTHLRLHLGRPLRALALTFNDLRSLWHKFSRSLGDLAQVYAG